MLLVRALVRSGNQLRGCVPCLGTRDTCGLAECEHGGLLSAPVNSSPGKSGWTAEPGRDPRCWAVEIVAGSTCITLTIHPETVPVEVGLNGRSVVCSRVAPWCVKFKYAITRHNNFTSWQLRKKSSSGQHISGKKKPQWLILGLGSW